MQSNGLASKLARKKEKEQETECNGRIRHKARENSPLVIFFKLVPLKLIHAQHLIKKMCALKTSSSIIRTKKGRRRRKIMKII